MAPDLAKGEMELLPSAAVPQIGRPANPRPVQPVRTSEALLALAVIVAIGLLMAAGFMLGRMERRRSTRNRTGAPRMNKRIDSRKRQDRERNLRLVTPKRR
jgi:hypothetical protein